MDSQQNMKSDDFSPSDMSAIESLLSNPKISTSQPCVYEMKEKQGADNSHLVQINCYNSLQDYEEYWIKPENLRNLRGCFQKDNYLG